MENYKGGVVIPISIPIVLGDVAMILAGLNGLETIRTVLDVGIGGGIYGALCRNFLDYTRNRLHREDWKIRIDGLEIFEEYKNPMWSLYDNILIGDCREFDGYDNYDLVILGDVIEHMTIQEGQHLLSKLNNKVIVVTPAKFVAQGPILGNVHEIHQCVWGPEHFPRDYRVKVVDKGAPKILATKGI